MIAEDLDTLDPEQLRQALRASRAEIAFKQAVIDKLTHENAILKRLKFAAKSEAYNAEQKSLLEETLDSDLAAVAAEIEAMDPSTQAAGEKPRWPVQTPPPVASANWARQGRRDYEGSVLRARRLAASLRR